MQVAPNSELRIEMERIFSYMWHPILYEEVPVGTGEKLKYAGDAVLLILLSKLIFGLMLGTEQLLGYDSLKQLLKTMHPINEDSTMPLFLVLSVGVAPVIEEIGFRGPFTRTKEFIVFSFSVLIVLLMNFCYLNLIEDSFSVNGWMRLALSVVLVGGLFIYFLPHKDSIATIVTRYRHHLFWLMAIAFALIHLPNYDLSSINNVQKMLLPVLMFPYLVMAMAFTYVRTKCGLAWAIGLHMANNLLVVLVKYSYAGL